MQALVVPTATTHDLTALTWAERPMPTLQADEVLLKTQAVGLNPVDYKLVTGPHPDWTLQESSKPLGARLPHLHLVSASADTATSPLTVVLPNT